MNIIFKKNISFKESLCGFTFDLPYFNNRSFKINNDPGNIITPNFKKMVPDMGMQRENKKGDLIIEFIIDYPKNITADQAKQISRILG
jgi:DnaJ-class molecular chaperone